MIINPHLTLTPDQQERFEAILQTIDFSITENDYDVARLMFKRMDAVITILRETILDLKKETPVGEPLPEGIAEEVTRLGANRNEREGSKSASGDE